MQPFPTIAGPLLALLVSGCSGRLAYDESWEIEKTEIPIPAGTRTLQVRVPMGEIQVEASDGEVIVYEAAARMAASSPEALEELRKLDFRFHADAEGDVLRLSVPTPPGTAHTTPREDKDPERALIFRSLLRVPRGLALDLRTERGPVSVREREAGVSIHTGAGDVQTVGIEGPLVAFSGHGNFLVSKHRGPLDLHTWEGKVWAGLSELRGDVRIRNVRIEDGEEKAGQGGGPIDCRIPEDAQFVADLRAPLGRISCPFPIPVSEAANGVGKQARGVHGDGGPTITLYSAVGNVALQSQQKSR